MIQKIFNDNNTNKLSGHFVVEQLIPFVGSPEIAESYIMEMIKAGTLIQEGKKLVLNIVQEPEPKVEPESTEEKVYDNETIKKNWFWLRQQEKKPDLDIAVFKIYCEAFVRNFGWNYYVFDKDLRYTLEKMGYHSVHEERALFQRTVLQS